MNRIKKIVTDLLRKTHVTNPIEICDLLDIDILRLNLGNTGGFKTTINRISTIYVNFNLPERIQTFIIAHELGHILLHKGLKTPFFKYPSENILIPKIEAEANMFAIFLLLSEFYHQHDLIYLSPKQLMSQIGLPLNLEYLFLETLNNLSKPIDSDK
ncbi:ImmA/IrrE family metallo-endopeptidase [Enterococcus sp. LJL98]